MKSFFYKFGQPFIIFLASFIFFSLFQFKKDMPLYSGEDSFYHIGMAKYILANGIPQKFPFLRFTTINDKFVDHEFLFHIILIPFIKLFGDNIGPKIMDVLFISLAFLFLFLIFRHFKLKLALFYSFLILLVMPCDFYFRMGFIREQGVALFLITLTFYLLLKNNSYLLAIVAFLFVWLYGGSVFIPVLIFLFFVSLLLTKEKIDGKIIFLGLAGFLLGLIINPYFPKNISFLFLQIFQTGIGAKKYSGGEWQPYDTWYWATISILPIIIFFGGISLALTKNIKIDAKKTTMVLFSIFLLLLQLKSKRFVEYWPFYASMAGVILAGQYFEKTIFKIKTDWEIIISTLAAALLLLFIGYKASYQIEQAYADTETPINIEDAKNAMDFLSENSSRGDVAFTDDWDVFPFYFYFNQKNNYIVGLDPEFMNQYDHTLYEEYANISSGAESYNLERIKKDFDAKWIIVGSDHPSFNFNLSSNPKLFEKVFQNNNYTIYKVR